MYVAGVDIGGTNLKFGVFDENGQLKAVPKKSANPQGGKKQKEALDDFDVFVE